MNVTLDLESETPWTFRPKEPKIVEPLTDPLALSAAWYRVRNSNGLSPVIANISTLLQRELFNEVTIEDQLLANKIRDHYSKKIMMWKLLNQPMSKFRDDLNNFIHNQYHQIDEKLLPLIYRLPEFYFYDVQFAEMIRPLNNEKIPSTHITSPEMTFYPLKEFKLNGRVKRNEYWLKDETNHAYVFTLTRDNSLKTLWDREFSKPEMSLSLKRVNRKLRDGFNYVVIDVI